MKKPKIILTIDDCPSKDFDILLNYLIKNKHKAILFCNGKDLEGIVENQQKIIKAIKNGFLIGNHSYSHKDFRFLSLEEAKKEILDTDKLIEELYKKARTKQPLKVFRFPHYREGGLKRSKLQVFLKDLGYENPYYKRKLFQKITCSKRHFLYHLVQRIHRGKYDMYCDLDPADWSTKTNVKSAISVIEKAKEGDILNLHDQEYSIKYLMKPICEKLVSMGFTLTF